MQFFLIIATFVGGPYRFGLRTQNGVRLNEQVFAVIDEHRHGPDFVPGTISFEEKEITEADYNALAPEIKWDSNELESLKQC